MDHGSLSLLVWANLESRCCCPWIKIERGNIGQLQPSMKLCSAAMAGWYVSLRKQLEPASQTLQVSTFGHDVRLQSPQRLPEVAATLHSPVLSTNEWVEPKKTLSLCIIKVFDLSSERLKEHSFFFFKSKESSEASLLLCCCFILNSVKRSEKHWSLLSNPVLHGWHLVVPALHGQSWCRVIPYSC